MIQGDSEYKRKLARYNVLLIEAMKVPSTLTAWSDVDEMRRLDEELTRADLAASHPKKVKA